MSVSSNQWDMSKPAWVIHKTLAGGSSARVLFFTETQGLVWARCYGVSSPKKQVLIQAYHPLYIDVTQKQGWYTVRHLESAGMPFDYAPPNLLTALYVNELVYHALQPQEAHPALYAAYVTTLQHLSLATSQYELEQVLRRFEWTLLAAMGYAISLSCEANTEQALDPERHYRFEAGQGFVRADEGILGANILALTQDDLTDPVVLKTAKQIMRAALHHALGGKRIKSRDFYRV